MVSNAYEGAGGPAYATQRGVNNGNTEVIGCGSYTGQSGFGHPAGSTPFTWHSIEGSVDNATWGFGSEYSLPWK